MKSVTKWKGVVVPDDDDGDDDDDVGGIGMVSRLSDE